MPRRKPGQPPKKTGRPAKVTPQHEAEILAILTVGASRQDCADYIGVHYKTLYKYWHKYPDFAVRMAQAEAKGKIHHLNKIGKAPQWQASAFMLERKWPLEFGRRDHHEHTGKNGEKLTIEVVYRKPTRPTDDDATTAPDRLPDDADGTDPTP